MNSIESDGTSFQQWMFIIKSILKEKYKHEGELNEADYRRFYDDGYTCEQAITVLFFKQKL